MISVLLVFIVVVCFNSEIVRPQGQEVSFISGELNVLEARMAQGMSLVSPWGQV